MLYYLPYLGYLWRIHRTLILMHGVYVSYNMVVWIVGTTSSVTLWFLSFFPKPYLQIEDKKRVNITTEDYKEDYVLLTQYDIPE